MDEDLTQVGEHAKQCTDDVLQNWAPEPCIAPMGIGVTPTIQYKEGKH